MDYAGVVTFNGTPGIPPKATTNATTVLHLAVERHKTVNARVVQLLLDAGADPAFKDAYNKTPLLYVINRTPIQIAVAKLLIARGASLNVRGNDGYDPISWALQQRQYERIPTLIALGADINAQDRAGLTILMRAARSPNREAVSVLLEHGADPNIADSQGRTALMYAVIRKGDYLDEPAIRALLASGAKAGVRDAAGNSVLNYARLPDHHPIYRLLVKAGAPEPKRN